jgi:NADH-quinone oxidoreductase subunit F
MNVPSDKELVDRWRRAPAPLLPLLHAFHDRDGFVSDDAIRAISTGLKTPLADLYGTITFYHHFARVPGGRAAPRVCTGPVCCLRGGEKILDDLRKDGASSMPCAGRCDEPIPVLRGDEVVVGVDSTTLRATPSPLPPPNPAGSDECVFRSIREPERTTIVGYRRGGGYEAIESVARDLSPSELTELVAKSGLAGRGGAGFPTGRKWQAVADAPGTPKTIVCNADEGEPGCFKDRALMDYDPHAVIEGMILAAFATGATRGFIYLRYEYPETFAILEHAIGEAKAAGFLGAGISGKGGFDFELDVRRGAGAYICGEEGSLLNSLEGKHPFPRNRPPYPVTHGYEDLPTVVNNVETLASVPPIVRLGAKWYQSLGIGEHAGTKVISLSGDIARPGNYEVPIGLPLRTLLDDWAGGPSGEHEIQAVTMAGLSGGFIAGDDLDATLDEPCLRGKGSFLGAGGIMVFDTSRDMVAVAHGAMHFFAEESCGKCFPCRIGTRRLTERLGTRRLTERLAGEHGPSDLESWKLEVQDIGEVMMATSACGLGIAAPLVTESLLKYFPEQVARHLESGPRK